MTDTSPDRTPNPVDRHVGHRIRDLRKRMHVSQERLAEELGLTFQQVQKYEKGSNRVSASKLYEIARALQTPVAYFFDGLADPSVGAAALGVAEPETPFLHDVGLTPEAGEVARLLSGMKARRRRLVLDLARSLADVEGGSGSAAGSDAAEAEET